MTQAFNLSQFANKVNTSGQADLTTAVTGTLPIANGGTGLTSVGTNGQILQSNGTALVYVTPSSGGVTSLNGQTGNITNTSLYAIGSYVMGRPQNTTTYSVNATIAGSSLYSTSNLALWNGSWESYAGTAGQSLVNTGTWRCVSSTGANNGGNIAVGLWVRIS